MSSAVHPNTHLLVSMQFFCGKEVHANWRIHLGQGQKCTWYCPFTISTNGSPQRWVGLIVTDFFLSIFSYTKRMRHPREHVDFKVSSNVETDRPGQGNPDALCNVVWWQIMHKVDNKKSITKLEAVGGENIKAFHPNLSHGREHNCVCSFVATIECLVEKPEWELPINNSWGPNELVYKHGGQGC